MCGSDANSESLKRAHIRILMCVCFRIMVNKRALLFFILFLSLQFFSSCLSPSQLQSQTPVEREADDFAIPLCLWQRAAFLSPIPGDADTDGGGERDSLRLCIAQLKHEQWRE